MAAYLPSWLDQFATNLDIEGESPHEERLPEAPQQPPAPKVGADEPV
jgi:hypothetical protein